jgi:Fur family iron response transcriptional regulator
MSDLIQDKFATGDIEKLLTSHKISPTRQRRQIARILFAKPQHLSAEEIMEKVNREAGARVVSKATVYNTLGLFVQKGLVREVIVNSNKVFYDSNTEEHHHFYNVDTGMLEDVGLEHLSLAAVPTVPAGTRLDGVDIIVRIRSSH